jgi:hypothetical protein
MNKDRSSQTGAVNGKGEVAGLAVELIIVMGTPIFHQPATCGF